MACPHTAIVSGRAKAEADLCKGTGPRRARQAHGQLSAGGAGWRCPAGHCWRAAVLAVTGRDQTAEEKYRIGYKYCEDLLADLSSGGGSGASWWSERGRTDRLIDLPPKSGSISSGMHMTK